MAVRDAPLDRELALGRTPEALEVFGGPAQQRRVVAMTVALRKAAQATALEVPRAWLPRRTHHRHGTTARRSASDGVEEPIEVQPNDTRVAPYERRGDDRQGSRRAFARQKYCRSAAAITIATSVPTIRTSGTR